MLTTHLDQALADELADKAETIHALKASDLGFGELLEENHALVRHPHRGRRPVGPYVASSMASPSALRWAQRRTGGFLWSSLAPGWVRPRLTQPRVER